MQELRGLHGLKASRRSQRSGRRRSPQPVCDEKDGKQKENAKTESRPRRYPAAPESPRCFTTLVRRSLRLSVW